MPAGATPQLSALESRETPACPRVPDPRRLLALDALRGATVISMVAFHVMYDLTHLYGINAPWFTDGPLQGIWRISISWVFLALAGWMTSLSRSNLKRGLRYSLVALLIWAATAVSGVGVSISYGIMYCMAASTLLWCAMDKFAPRLASERPSACAALLLLAFATLYMVPRSSYPFEGFAWLGFPGSEFRSADYYPIIPFSLLFLSSAYASRGFARSGRKVPAWMYRDVFPPLTFVGRHALAIYVMHQPIALAVIEIFMR